MRSDKELGEVLLANQDLFVRGLCYWSERLRINGHITHKEKLRLYSLIDCNIPEGASTYYWPIGQLQPRLDWINRVLINGEKV